MLRYIQVINNTQRTSEEENGMTLNRKYRVAGEVRARYGGGLRKVKWNEVFSTEEELVEALKDMEIISFI